MGQLTESARHSQRLGLSDARRVWLDPSSHEALAAKVLTRIAYVLARTVAVLVLLLALSQQSSAAGTIQSAEPIRLPLTFIQGTPVTTISVAGRDIQAIVDISGGDADGALTLTKEAIESARGVPLGTALANDAFGHEFTRPRFSVSGVVIGGSAFQNLRVVQALGGSGEGPVPNAIGKHFLSQYLLVVDYAGAVVSLWPRETRLSALQSCGRTRIPMEHTAEERLAVSYFDTPSGRMRLLWGTGNAYSMLSDTVAEKLHLATATRGPDSPKFYRPQTLVAAGQNLTPVDFIVLPLKLPADFEGVIGGNFFEHRVVCLDYRTRKIAFN